MSIRLGIIPPHFPAFSESHGHASGVTLIDVEVDVAGLVEGTERDAD